MPDPILDDPHLMVEPFESVLQQLRGTNDSERQAEADRLVMAAARAAVTSPLPEADADAEDLDVDDTAELDLDAAAAPEPQAEPSILPIRPTEPQPVREPIAEILRLLPENAVKPATPVPAAVPAPAPAPTAARSEPQSNASEPEAAVSSSPRRGSRVKTTFLGFERSDGRIEDVFQREAPAKDNTGRCEFPFGWVVIIKGPGRGTAIAIGAGVSQIGRGDDQAIQLDFGDNSISRNNHAAIAFDDEDRKFYLGHGGKANIVRLNGKPVLSTEPLSDGDLIRIGETTMSFVAFCGEDFVWGTE
ncbi:FHA domain-containing protein [Albidovulum sediminis]|uniref:FHA domain-containing protein n=1 Tax=Albidovulum sediminis TaxID=3066345 RepID=A0ABT2NSS5_9RHOB|nr:FHA domain-containing protein [Defluviimonas sediminis]MCT8331771.1 FHA domain-containing protein [Defluviimonas sediminis]